MSNLHLSLDEANKHPPKGFDPASINTFPWKDELGESTYRDQMELPKAINFVDGTVAAPTTADGDIYVLIGAGVIDGSWGGLANFGDWVRFTNAIANPVTPSIGSLCYDATAASWMEYDGANWVTFGVNATNLSEGTSTTTTVDVDSDTGTNATLQPASTLRAGVMSKAKFDEVVVNTAKTTNVSTNLSIGTKTASTVDVNSSDGANATVPSFTSSEAGLTPSSGGGTTNFLRADGSWVAAGISDGDKGDITVSSSGAQWDIDADVVTFAKMQNVAQGSILLRSTTGLGDIEEGTLSPDLQILLGVLGLNTTPMYISDMTTVNLLDDLANWTGSNYTGLLITGTFQGQKHYNSTYFFECTIDNIWIRMARA